MAKGSRGSRKLCKDDPFFPPLREPSLPSYPLPFLPRLELTYLPFKAGSSGTCYVLRTSKPREGPVPRTASNCKQMKKKKKRRQQAVTILCEWAARYKPPQLAATGSMKEPALIRSESNFWKRSTRPHPSLKRRSSGARYVGSPCDVFVGFSWGEEVRADFFSFSFFFFPPSSSLHLLRLEGEG